MADELHPIDQQLCFALYAASRAMTAAYQAQLAELDLTYPQYLVLLVLWTQPAPSASVGELGLALQLDSGTLTPLLKRLEARGLVTRMRRTGPGDDQRVVDIALTAAGKRMRQRGCLVSGAIARATPGFRREDVARLRAELQRLTTALGGESAA